MDMNAADKIAPRSLSSDANASMAPTILPLRLENVCFEANGLRLIDDLSFELRAGLRTVILGSNGAGKSLTLRLCHGLLKPSAGAVRWNPDIPDPAMRQAMVFQKPVLLRRSVAANVEYGMRIRNVPRAERKARTEDALTRTGLIRFSAKPARLLSGGEQQKLALARAWTLRPEVLFLDEPTASLDPAAMHGVEEIIQAMQAEGTRIVMTTHDMGQARRIADEVMFLHKGRLLEHTDADTFFEGPQSGEAKAFLKGELKW